MTQLVDVSSLLLSLVLVGFLTETCVEILKPLIKDVFKKSTETIILIASLVIAVLLCVTMGVSLFEPDNKTTYYVGMVVCGLVASRGSNYVHNVLDTMPRKLKS